MSDTVKICVEARVRETVEKHPDYVGLKFSSEYFDALNERVKRLILTSAQRAKDNGRVTLKPQDV